MRRGSTGVIEPDGLLRRLRGDGVPRPEVDPGLAGGLRDWLEDGLVEAVATLPVGAGRRAGEQGVAQPGPRCARPTSLARRRAPRVVHGGTGPRGAWWTPCSGSGSPPESSTTASNDALAAFEVEGDRDGVVAFVAGLPAGPRRRMMDEVAEHAAHITARLAGA